jgi:two-component system NtrC family sensor kinase
MPEKKKSILVVDRDKDVVDALCDILSDEYQVSGASSEKEVLEIPQQHEINLIISDHPIPDNEAIDFSRATENSHLNSGKVLLSGCNDISRTVDGLKNVPGEGLVCDLWNKGEFSKIVMDVVNIRLQKSLKEGKEIKAQLIHSAKMASLGELLAGILHEVNNPLGFIYANLGNLNKFCKKIIGLIDSYDTLALPDPAKAELATIKENINYEYLRKRLTEMIERSLIGADRMKKIIEDVKSFARKRADVLAEDDIHEAIDATLTILHNEYKGRIEIKKEYGNLPPVRCYISKLNQVFVNLLVNACHAIEGTGVITIKTCTEGNMHKIEISDTGGGIPKEVIDSIFDPFFTTKPEGVGTGLGLSISYDIVKQHNGELSVKSQEGVGTTFTLTLPAHPK